MQREVHTSPEMAHDGAETNGTNPSATKDRHDLASNPIISTTGSATPPPYVPQFSAATSLILNRMKEGSQGLNSALSSVSASILQPDRAAFEEARSRLVQSMATSMTLPVPSALQKQAKSMSTTPSSSAPYSNYLLKRKRDPETAQVDFSQSTIPFPLQQQSKMPRLESQMKGVATKKCFKCESQDAIPEDRLVTCERCSKSWHQTCHSPVIAPEVAQTLTFQCTTCAAEREDRLRLLGKDKRRRQQEVDRLREKRLAALPRGVVPAKPELVGFSAGNAPDFTVGVPFCPRDETTLLTRFLADGIFLWNEKNRPSEYPLLQRSVKAAAAG